MHGFVGDLGLLLRFVHRNVAYIGCTESIASTIFEETRVFIKESVCGVFSLSCNTENRLGQSGNFVPKALERWNPSTYGD